MGSKPNMVITGMPGCGKTTLFKKLAHRLKNLRPVGFYTEEIRPGRERTGFALRSLDGRAGRLAGVDISGRHRVGKYGVDVEGFERFLDAVDLNQPTAGLVMIDEIGKMECLSPRFQQMIREILASERLLIATVAQHGGGLIEEIKRRKDVRIYTLTVQNRDSIAESILMDVHA